MNGPVDRSATITVVIPTRDRPSGVREAIDSVRAQTYRSWEIIVVDDGSTGAAGREVRALAGDVADCRLITLPVSVGAAQARNLGMAEARGDFIGFLDDDDVWKPEFLDRMAATLDAHPEADVAYCRALHESPAGDRLPVLPDLTDESHPLSVLVTGNFIGTPTALVRREPLEAIGGFDPELPRLQDWDLWLRLATDSRFVRVDEVLVRCHATPGGISDSPDRLVEACRLLAERRPAELHLGRRERADFHYALATFLMVGGARTAALPYFLRSLAARPWPPRRIAAAATAVLAPAVYAAVTRRRAAAES